MPVATILFFALLSAVMAIRSDGVYLDDDLCHYQIARAAWHDVSMLLNIWGRPGFTVPHALVANIGSTAAGFRACRLLTSAMYTAAVWLTWLTARRMRTPFAHWVPLLMLLMPEGFSESFTPCTEAPAALYAIAGTYFLSRGKRWPAAMFFALLPVTRHELIPFLLPLAIYFLWRRDAIAALLLGWAEAAWAAASWRVGAEQPIRRYWTAGPALYGSGNLFSYLFNWFKMAGAAMVILCILGAIVIALHEWRAAGGGRWKRSTVPGRRARLRVLVFGGAIGLVALETFLFMFNRFASGGYSTFLVPAAPFMAICACYAIGPCLRAWRFSNLESQIVNSPARGLLRSTGRGDWKTRLTRAAFILALLVSIAQWVWVAHPYRMGAHQALIGRTIAQLRREHPGCHVVGHSAWITYFDEISPGARDMPGIDVWIANRLPELYYLYDPAPGFSPPMEQVMFYPNEWVASLKVDPSNPGFDLFIFHRLAD